MKRIQVETILEPQSLNTFEKLGDWFILFMIVKNLDTLTINDLIKQVCILRNIDKNTVSPRNRASGLLTQINCSSHSILDWNWIEIVYFYSHLGLRLCTIIYSLFINRVIRWVRLCPKSGKIKHSPKFFSFIKVHT